MLHHESRITPPSLRSIPQLSHPPHGLGSLEEIERIRGLAPDINQGNAHSNDEKAICSNRITSGGLRFCCRHSTRAASNCRPNRSYHYGNANHRRHTNRGRNADRDNYYCDANRSAAWPASGPGYQRPVDWNDRRRRCIAARLPRHGGAFNGRNPPRAGAVASRPHRVSRRRHGGWRHCGAGTGVCDTSGGQRAAPTGAQH